MKGRTLQTIPGEGKTEFFVDNSGLGSTKTGLNYRRSPDLANKDTRIKLAEYGSTIFANKLSEDWVHVHDPTFGDRYLPIRVQGIVVLTPVDIEKQQGAAVADELAAQEVSPDCCPEPHVETGPMPVDPAATEHHEPKVMHEMHVASSICVEELAEESARSIHESPAIAEATVAVVAEVGSADLADSMQQVQSGCQFEVFSQAGSAQESATSSKPAVVADPGVQTQIVHEPEALQQAQPSTPSAQAVQTSQAVSMQPQARIEVVTSCALDPSDVPASSVKKVKTEKRLSAIFRKRASQSDEKVFTKEPEVSKAHYRND